MGVWVVGDGGRCFVQVCVMGNRRSGGVVEVVGRSGTRG